MSIIDVQDDEILSPMEGGLGPWGSAVGATQWFRGGPKKTAGGAIWLGVWGAEVSGRGLGARARAFMFGSLGSLS